METDSIRPWGLPGIAGWRQACGRDLISHIWRNWKSLTKSLPWLQWTLMTGESQSLWCQPLPRWKQFSLRTFFRRPEKMFVPTFPETLRERGCLQSCVPSRMLLELPPAPAEGRWRDPGGLLWSVTMTHFCALSCAQLLYLRPWQHH